MVLIKYGLADEGRIAGVWNAATEDLLLPNIVTDDPIYGYLLTDAITEPRHAGARYRVDPVTETLEEKTEVTIVAVPATFAADGVTECLLTVDPFVPCTLLVNMTPQVLTAEDPVLTLTSMDPARFFVTLDESLITHWALPVSVEAV